MDQSTVQLLTATAGFIATLGGVLITQYFNRKSESTRRRHEMASRWHDENYRVSASIVTKAAAIERGLSRAAVVLDNEERLPRLPAGLKSVLASPKEGITGYFDEEARAILVAAVEEGFVAIEEIEDLVGELEIIGSNEQSEAGLLLIDQIVNALAHMEGFGKASDVYDELLGIREERESFASATRRSVSGFHSRGV